MICMSGRKNCEKRLSFVVSISPRATTRLPLDGFLWNLIFEYFRKSVEKISSFVKIWLEWPVLCKKISVHFFNHIRLVIFRMRNILDTSCKEKQNTHFMYFFSENCDVYEVMWKDIVEPDRPEMTISRMRIPCWIPKAANTHCRNRQYLLLFNCKVVARTRLNVTFYFIASLVSISSTFQTFHLIFGNHILLVISRFFG